MYCVYGESGSSLPIESTDSMIYIQEEPIEREGVREGGRSIAIGGQSKKHGQRRRRGRQG